MTMTHEAARQLAADCKAEHIEAKLIPCRRPSGERHTQVEVRGSVVRTLEQAQYIWNARKGKARGRASAAAATREGDSQ